MPFVFLLTSLLTQVHAEEGMYFIFRGAQESGSIQASLDNVSNEFEVYVTGNQEQGPLTEGERKQAARG
ncbi:hypothetical protein K2X30_05615 [bacterium]|nr:hypothetical protein [bacterium]